MSYLLFDIGGTNTRLAVSKDGQNFDEPVILSTPQNFEEAIEIIGNKALEISDNNIEISVGGLAGSLNKEKTGIYRAPNLYSWEQKNFKEEFAKKTNSTVFIENDTALVGLGEAVNGAGKSFNLVVYYTFSTGTNAVKISNKKIDENVFGFEIGRQIIDVVTHIDVTSNVGNLEGLVAGSSLEKKFGMPPEKIEDDAEWRKIAIYSAIGIYNSVLHWSPEAVIFGGSLTQKLPMDILTDKLRMLISDVYPESPEFLRAELGSVGGLYGSLNYLQSIINNL